MCVQRAYTEVRVREIVNEGKTVASKVEAED